MCKCMSGIFELLTPQNTVFALIDYQPQMLLGVGSMERGLLINNVCGLLETAKIFDVPTILTTVCAKSFSGEILEQIRNISPENIPIDRTSLNSWEDENFKNAIVATGRKKLVMAGLWTEVCLALPTLSALEEGYEVYIVVDASAGLTEQIHNTAVARMIQAGARPVTWAQILYEFQRDWARQESYEAVIEVTKKYTGAFGVGVSYAKEFGIGENSL